MIDKKILTPTPLRPIPSFIFTSRWFQLLKQFVNAASYVEKVLIAQTAIHITFPLSDIAIAYTDRLMQRGNGAH